MHRMMYRMYLDRVSESVFGAQKFEFCPNKGKKSGSRIAYLGLGEIPHIIQKVAVRRVNSVVGKTKETSQIYKPIEFEKK